MTLRRQFDYGEFLEGYRTACEAWGIDPAEGATGYEVVHVRAEQQQRAWQAGATTERRWWQQHELWIDCPPYCSDTEGEAVWNLFAQAYSVTVCLLVRGARLRRAAEAAISG